MDIYARDGFDPELSVLLTNVKNSVTLSDVCRAFARDDRVIKIAWVGENAVEGLLCEFEENITLVLLDNEHPNSEGNDYWKVVQIDYLPTNRRVLKKGDKIPQSQQIRSDRGLAGPDSKPS